MQDKPDKKNEIRSSEISFSGGSIKEIEEPQLRKMIAYAAAMYGCSVPSEAELKAIMDALKRTVLDISDKELEDALFKNIEGDKWTPINPYGSISAFFLIRVIANYKRATKAQFVQ